MNNQALVPLVIITGTGTGIGKTFFATTLVRVLGEHHKIAGIKPIESGVDRDNLSGDAHELGQVSTFHVTRFTAPYLLMDAVSPHLAARREGKSIDLNVVATWVAAIREEAEGVVLELPGGLFSPLRDDATNASLLRILSPSHVLLVAPDRLGVLHDVIAAMTAARAEAIAISGIVVAAPSPSTRDTSSGSNATELARVLRSAPPLFEQPWITSTNAKEFASDVHGFAKSLALFTND